MSSGAERLEQAFRGAGRPLYVPYVMGGYPDLATSRSHAHALAKYADILELGVPFSDPLADGPTIQAAGQQALDAGARPEDIVEIAAGLRDGPPVVIMTYVNTVLAADPGAYFEHAAQAGVAGIIIPDLPIDEGGELRDAASRAGVAMVALAAPTTDDDRMAAIGRAAEGFVYCVSVAGVTGGDVVVGDELRDFIARARRHIEVPLVVGFGVRTPAHAVAIGEIADGVVIASHLIRLFEEAESLSDGEAQMNAFSEQITAALAGS